MYVQKKSCWSPLPASVVCAATCFSDLKLLSLGLWVTVSAPEEPIVTREMGQDLESDQAEQTEQMTGILLGKKSDSCSYAQNRDRECGRKENGAGFGF